MSVYKLKGLVKRGAAFAMAVGLLSGIAVWAVPQLSFADALNPLTERTLLLSSSSPGFHYTDAAGNTGQYALPGSGPNGKQTGETFSFRVSTDSVTTGKTLKAFTLQYCTTAAGFCTAPGDNTGDADPNNDGSTADSTRESNNTAIPLGRSDLEIVGTFTDAAGATPGDGEFVVYDDTTSTASTGWTMTSLNAESEDSVLNTGALTGKKNLIQLVNSGGATPAAGDKIEIIFKPSNSTYITNPGSGAFFVKINDYDTATNSLLVPTVPEATNPDIVDGGVTVANVMTDSIQIQTKVLETMSFSVGTTNPDTQDPGAGTHGPCDPITVNSALHLGDPTQEYSLQVEKAWDVNSYWRLSSNSSNGASVYYSGYTLSNTEGDQIDPAGDFSGPGGTLAGSALSHPSEEQFGLAFDTEDTPETASGKTPAPTNTLSPLTGDSWYTSGSGAINGGSIAAAFAFDPNSATTPALIANENTDVVTCSTGKMRYIGNIAAVTPAGIYASKVNYLAAPEY